VYSNNPIGIGIHIPNRIQSAPETPQISDQWMSASLATVETVQTKPITRQPSPTQNLVIK